MADPVTTALETYTALREASTDLLRLLDYYIPEDPSRPTVWDPCRKRLRRLLGQENQAASPHPFVVRHYTNDDRPSVKGNGFDGLEIGKDRQEAEEFVAWINERPCPALAETLFSSSEGG